MSASKAREIHQITEDVDQGLFVCQESVNKFIIALL
jgi:hypothetical protein